MNCFFGKMERNIVKEYKILALDIDGTLLNSKKEITPAVFEKVRALQEKEIPVLIASGRPEQGTRHVCEALELKTYGGYVLSFNGGKITNQKTGEIVHNKTIPVEYNEEIIEYAKKIPESTILTYDGDVIITEHPENKYAQVESNVVKMPLQRVESLKERAVFPANKFLIVGTPEILKAAVEPMAEAFQGRLNIFQSEPFFIEVVPLGIDKAQSLETLLQKLGMTREELVACGDGGNDVSMIDYAGMGVAMANACEEVKAVADFMAPSCDEDGVAAVIEKFFL